jgi:4-diphosphocytidyl-2-C-methyl-D-erythritol kinase
LLSIARSSKRLNTAISTVSPAVKGSAQPWPAPAKLNLFLHILGRRPDGYHELQTVFQFIDLHDDLHIEVRSDGAIERASALAGVTADEDLAVRAARLLQAETGCPLGASIAVTKRIPMGGGLGGGSSDAATALLALNHLWGLELDAERLRTLGLRLGADVPVFLFGQSAWAEGVGERLSAVDPAEGWYLVVKAETGVSTAAVFNDPELTRDSPAIKIARFHWAQVRNDCERVVRKRYPRIAAALDWLGRYGTARLTGTGACVFLCCESEAQSRELLGALPAGWQGYAVQGRNRSPLLDRLDAARRLAAAEPA